MTKAKTTTTPASAVFAPPLAGVFFHDSADRYWREQDAIVSDLQRFADDWCARRHAGTQAAMKCAEKLTQGGAPGEAIAAWNEWAAGAWARLVDDVREQTELTVSITQKLALANRLAGPPVEEAGDVRVTDSGAASRGSPKAAAAK